MRRIYINGRFLSRALTGVERYAREVVLALDRSERLSATGATWTLLVPSGADEGFVSRLVNIDVQLVPGRAGHMWEQTALAAAAKGGVLIGLCNAGPVLHANQLVVLHDAAVFRRPGDYGLRYRIVHQGLSRLLSRRARLATVSDVSRRELSQVLGVREVRIAVLPNGAEHLAGAAADETSTEVRVSGDYFLFVGGHSPRKNLAGAVRALDLIDRRDVALVVVGRRGGGVFGDTEAAPDWRIVYVEDADDADLAGLYQGAAGLVFPSFYEGFGIPPLEAMSQGCPVLVSDIPVSREVCGEAALYFDPHDPASIAGCMSRVLAQPELAIQLAAAGRRRVAAFSWSRTAENLIEEVMRFDDPGERK